MILLAVNVPTVVVVHGPAVIVIVIVIVIVVGPVCL